MLLLNSTETTSKQLKNSLERGGSSEMKVLQRRALLSKAANPVTGSLAQRAAPQKRATLELVSFARFTNISVPQQQRFSFPKRHLNIGSTSSKWLRVHLLVTSVFKTTHLGWLLMAVGLLRGGRERPGEHPSFLCPFAEHV